MKFTLALPTDRVDAPAEFLTGDAVADMARTIERCGFQACFVTDHPAPDTRWLAGGGHHALEPTVALSFAAAATTELLLHTHVYVLAYRNPFLAAKALSSLDVLSGGRLVIGIASGYLRPEFAAAGVDFARRNELTDEALRMLRRLWAGEAIAGEGEGWRAVGVAQLPAPARQPTIWIGGNSRAAIRRAVAYGQGWSPFHAGATLSRAAKTARLADLDDLAERLRMLREECERAGRTEPLDVCFGAFSLARYLEDPSRADEYLDELGRLGELGVTWSAVTLPAATRAELLERIEQFAETVAPLRSTTR